MKRALFSTLLTALVLPVLSLHAQEPERLPLWPAGEPENAFITVHRPEKPNGAAVVICPGGGYASLVKGPEGDGIAKWLNSHGITGVVLEYRLPNGRSNVPLDDALRAIRTTRLNATKWGVDPKRIGIMGFSAGGHVASTAGTHFDDGKLEAKDEVDRMGSRPDFMVLIYPVITMDVITHGGSKKNLLGAEPSSELVRLFSNELQVTGKTPPAFLAHALDDKVVPIEHSRRFHEALRARNVPSELLELPSGGHGLNGYKGPLWDKWQERSLVWLESIRMIPAP